jgi:hypothetical protein
MYRERQRREMYTKFLLENFKGGAKFAGFGVDEEIIVY